MKAVLAQRDVLVPYFRVLCQRDPTTNHDVILLGLEDDITWVYLEFLAYALNLFNEFNAFFQADLPLLYTLKDRVEHLLTTIASNLMEPDYVSSVDPLRIDPDSSGQYLPVRDVYLGITLNLFNLIRRVTEIAFLFRYGC